MSCTVALVAGPERDVAAAPNRTDQVEVRHSPLEWWRRHCSGSDALAADWMDVHCSEGRGARAPLAVGQSGGRLQRRKRAVVGGGGGGGGDGETAHRAWSLGIALAVVAAVVAVRSSHVKSGHWQAFEVDMHQHQNQGHCRSEDAESGQVGHSIQAPQTADVHRAEQCLPLLGSGDSLVVHGRKGDHLQGRLLDEVEAERGAPWESSKVLQRI